MLQGLMDEEKALNKGLPQLHRRQIVDGCICHGRWPADRLMPITGDGQAICEKRAKKDERL